MKICLFVIARGIPTEPPQASQLSLRALARSVPGLRYFVAHFPAAEPTRDPYLAPETAPCCTLQFYFDDLEAAETMLVRHGVVETLADPAHFPIFGQCYWTHQVMAVRYFPTPQPKPPVSGEIRCTYLVGYEGEADNTNHWLSHYIAGHPPIMIRFPAIREVEIYTRLDWISGTSLGRENAMQRNKVVFDSTTDLNFALASPVRNEMRADFHRFPPFHGSNFHYPVLSHIELPA